MNKIDLPENVRAYDAKQRIKRAVKAGCAVYGIVSGTLLVLAILNLKTTVSTGDLLGILVVGLPFFVLVSTALFIRYTVSTTLIRIVKAKQDEEVGHHDTQ